MATLEAFKSVIARYMYWAVPTSFNAVDIIEIIIIAIAFYELMAWVKRTRAWVLMKGILFIIAFVIVAAIFQMTTILWLASKLFNVAIIALIVVFQPELRNALEHLGRKRILHGIFSFDTQDVLYRRDVERMADEVASACMDMSRTLTGALIVFERDVPLDEYVRTGIEVDARVSSQLIRNIFEHNTPLHDGAVIVSDLRITAATCYLPLSDRKDINKSFGTRHRAAVGISEVSDSLTVIVSEETGRISVAREGVLDTGLDRDGLKKAIISFELRDLEENGKGRFRRRFGYVKEDN